MTLYMLIPEDPEPIWTAQSITLRGPHLEFQAQAEVLGQLAVHQMIELVDGEPVLAPGWAISHAEKGFRLACGGRVFKNADLAKRVAAAILPLMVNWDDFFDKPLTDEFRTAFTAVHMAADPEAYLSLRVLAA